MIDIHCHLLPGIDDGAESLSEALRMAELAVADGITTVIATPHQLGNFRHNRAEAIRQLTNSFQSQLHDANIPLRVLPGADVRVEPDLVSQVLAGEVLSLADQQRYVLLELPHELYFPLTPLLRELAEVGMVGILSHPERNQGLLANPRVVAELVDAGCLMQVTGASLTGGFGASSQRFAEQLVRSGLVHFVASDGHGVRSRRPHLGPSRKHIAQLTGEADAIALTETLPQAVVDGQPIPQGKRQVTPLRTGRWLRWPSRV